MSEFEPKLYKRLEAIFQNPTDMDPEMRASLKRIAELLKENEARIKKKAHNRHGKEIASKDTNAIKAKTQESTKQEDDSRLSDHEELKEEQEGLDLQQKRLDRLNDAVQAALSFEDSCAAEILKDIKEINEIDPVVQAIQEATEKLEKELEEHRKSCPGSEEEDEEKKDLTTDGPLTDQQWRFYSLLLLDLELKVYRQAGEIDDFIIRKLQEKMRYEFLP